MRFARLRLRTQLIILVTTAMLITIALLILLSIVQIRQILSNDVEQRARLVTEANADLTGERLRTLELDEVDAIIGASVRQQVVDGVSVFDSAGRPLLERGLTNDPVRRQYERTLVQQALSTGKTANRQQNNTLIFAVPARSSGGVEGVLVVTTQASEASNETTSILTRMLVVGLILALLTTLAVLLVANYASRPLHILARAARAIGQGVYEAPATGRGGEIGELEQAFGQMARDIQASRAEIEAQNATLERRVAERTAALERTVAELREASAAREQLSAAIREMSSPVVPVLEGILVMPLVGVIDSERAETLLDALLEAIERHRAAIVIMDVTGVPIVDTQVARTLLDAAGAARLLGARTVLVGLRPEVAQTIVGLGLDLSGLVTRADLQSGVEYAMRQRQSTKVRLVEDRG